MQKKTIQGMDVTVFALGAGAIGPIDRDAEEFRIRDAYVDRGGNFFDTARMYGGGRTDEAIGRWLKTRKMRDKIIVCMKGCFPADPRKMYISRVSQVDIQTDLELSLKAMGTDYADFYLLHRDDPLVPVEEIMSALHKLVRDGKTRAVGCSNWTIGRINEANAFAKSNGLAPLSVSQMHHSLALTTPAQTRDITHVTMNDVERSWYKATNFPVMAFAPQGRGYFARRLQGLEQKPGNVQYYDHIPENHARSERLMKLSQDMGRSIAAILSAYVRDSGLNAIVLNAFSSVDQMEDAFGAETFTLTNAEVRFLETGG